MRVCIFDGEAVKSAFALLLTKVTKPSQGNLLSRVRHSLRIRKMLTYITKEEDFDNGKNNQFYEWGRFYWAQHEKIYS